MRKFFGKILITLVLLALTSNYASAQHRSNGFYGAVVLSGVLAGAVVHQVFQAWQEQGMEIEEKQDLDKKTFKIPGDLFDNVSNLLKTGKYRSSAIRGTFVTNELKPFKAKEHLVNLPKNSAYLVVGSSTRAYTYAALAEVNHSAIKRLIMFDRDPVVALFSYIDTVLIHAAKSPSDYLMLHRNPDIWKTRIGFPIEYKDELTAHEKNEKMVDLVDFWKTVQNAFRQNFEIYYAKPGSSENCNTEWDSTLSLSHLPRTMTYVCEPGKGLPFENSNPFWDLGIFASFKRLAKSVEIHTFDIADSSDVSKIAKSLVKQNIQIGVVDTSNIFPLEHLCNQKIDSSRYSSQEIYDSYAKQSTPRSFLESLKEALDPNAILVIAQRDVIGSHDKFKYPGDLEKSATEIDPNAKIPLNLWVYRSQSIEKLLNKQCPQASLARVDQEAILKKKKIRSW